MVRANSLNTSKSNRSLAIVREEYPHIIAASAAPATFAVERTICEEWAGSLGGMVTMGHSHRRSGKRIVSGAALGIGR